MNVPHVFDHVGLWRRLAVVRLIGAFEPVREEQLDRCALGAGVQMTIGQLAGGIGFVGVSRGLS